MISDAINCTAKFVIVTGLIIITIVKFMKLAPPPVTTTVTCCSNTDASVLII